jgi:hypothetical protein
VKAGWIRWLAGRDDRHEAYGAVLPRDGLAPALVIAIAIAAVAAGGWLGTRAGGPETAALDVMPTVAPTAVPADGEQLERAVLRLSTARADSRRALALASRPAGQAAAARDLRRTYRLAAARVRDAAPPVTEALLAAADAYGRLARAAEAGDRRGYARARTAAAAAERALERAVAARL